MGFYLYKGLKKPLTFFGLKGKYIYYSVGVIAVGFLIIVILKTILGLIGLIVGVALIGGGIWYIIRLQDTKGLYNKTKNDKEIYIFPKRRMKINK